MEKLSNVKFQKLEQYKIENLDLVRGGSWLARTRDLGETQWSDNITVSYSNGDGDWVSEATNRKDYGEMVYIA